MLLRLRRTHINATFHFIIYPKGTFASLCCPHSGKAKRPIITAVPRIFVAPRRRVAVLQQMHPLCASIKSQLWILKNDRHALGNFTVELCPPTSTSSSSRQMYHLNHVQFFYYLQVAPQATRIMSAETNSSGVLNAHFASHQKSVCSSSRMYDVGEYWNATPEFLKNSTDLTPPLV